MGKLRLLKFLKLVGHLIYLALRLVILIVMLAPVLIPLILAWIIINLEGVPQLPESFTIIALLISIGAFSYLLQRNIDAIVESISNIKEKIGQVVKNTEIKKNLIEMFTESQNLFFATLFLCIIVICGNFSVKDQIKWQGKVSGRVDTLMVKADSIAISDLKAWKDSVTNMLETTKTKTKDISNNLSQEIQTQSQYRIEQREFNRKLRNAIDMLQVKIAAIPDSTEIAKLRTFIDKRHNALVDSLNNKFHRQTNHLTQIKDSLKVNFQKIQEQHENFHSVFVCVVIKDSSEYQKYLGVWRSFIFFKKYKIKKFPDIDSSDVKKVAIGDTLRVQGTLIALYDYKGKLRKGKEYALIEQPDSSQTLVVFSRPLIAGQRILAVRKK